MKLYRTGTGYRGLTLPEMMITLAVVFILVTIAVPSFKDLLADRRVASFTQELYGSLMLARSEAVKRRSPVSLCKSSNGTGCTDSADDWQTGWLIFEDEDADGDLDTEDRPIRVFDALPDVVAMDWNNGDTLGFNSQGQARQAGSFTICEPNATGFEVRQVIVSMTGRARVSESGSCP